MDNEEKKQNLTEQPEQDTPNDGIDGSAVDDLLHVLGFKRKRPVPEQTAFQNDTSASGLPPASENEFPDEAHCDASVPMLPSDTAVPPRKRKRIGMGIAAGVLLLGLITVGYLLFPRLTEPHPPAPDVVAEYYGTPITVEQLKAFIEIEGAKEREHAYCPIHGYDHSQCTPDEECESHPVDSLNGYREMTNRYAVEKIIAAWAESEGITQRQDVQHGMSDLLNDAAVEQYVAALHTENISPEAVSKWDVQEYYSENQSQFEGKTLDEAETSIRQILAQQKDETFFDEYIDELKKTSGLQVNFEVLQYAEPSDADIAAYYQENLEQYAVQAQFQYTELRFDAASKNSATDFLRKVRSGENFEAAAERYAEADVLSEQTVSQSDTTASAKALAALQVGQISDLIANADGSVSILRLDGVENSSYRPLSEVSAEIRSLLASEAMEQEYNLRKSDLLFSIHSRRYTLGEFYQEFQELSSANQQRFATYESKKQLVEQMIAQELLLEKSSDNASAGEDHSMEELRVQYLWQIMHKEKVDAELPEPTEEEIEAFYNENPEMVTTPASVELSLIWIDQGQNGEKKEQAFVKANEALSALNAGTPFADAAKLYSEDSSASNGGELSGQYYKAYLAEDIANAVFALNVGETTGIIDFHNGYYIMQVRSRTEAQIAPLDDVRSMIVNHLNELAHEQQTKQLEEQMLEQAGYVVYERTLRKLVNEQEK